jgi:hypothetical protein
VQVSGIKLTEGAELENVRNGQLTVLKNDQAAVAQVLKNPVHVNVRDRGGISQVPLRQT